jgi:hypothetical protein
MEYSRTSTIIAAATAIALAVLGCGGGPGIEHDAAQSQVGLVGAAVPIDGWQIESEPLVYVGDGLFELINGGAEIYHRHGFVQALAAEYGDADGRSIALEVFEMGDADGAAEIFAEKTGGSGKPLEIGDESAFESYYLNVRTGRYLITITGFESDDETTDGIRQLAGAVAKELGGRS